MSDKILNKEKAGFTMNPTCLSFWVSVLIYLATVTSLGLEADNFTFAKNKRDQVTNNLIVDLTEVTNNSINQYIQKLAGAVKNCYDRQTVMIATKFIFDTNFPDISQDLYRFSKPEVRGYLQGTSSNEVTPLYRGFKTPGFDGCCAPVVLTGGVAVGTDKIDHFLSSGFLYYKEYSERRQTQVDLYGRQELISILRTDSDEKRTTDAIKIGKRQEETIWGLSGSGVKSYGDLAANYGGLQFYKNLFEGKNPYLKCVEGKFVIARTFRIEDYIDDSWDESINCSSFNTKENRDVVVKNINAMGFKKCPIDARKCELLSKKYGDVKNDILHPLCADPASKHGQVEDSLSNVSNFFKTLEYFEPRDIQKAIGGVR